MEHSELCLGYDDVLVYVVATCMHWQVCLSTGSYLRISQELYQKQVITMVI